MGNQQDLDLDLEFLGCCLRSGRGLTGDLRSGLGITTEYSVLSE